MKIYHDLSKLNWKLTGWTPYIWRMSETAEIGDTPSSEILAVPAKVPGSVQESLRQAGILPNWNIGTNWLKCEWVENRSWIYETVLPQGLFKSGMKYKLNCRGLDYQGCIVLNGKIIADFTDTYIPHIIDLTQHMVDGTNVLRIAFENSPRWLGQAGFTSTFTEWKPRFYYTWDWCVRLMQIGIWDSIWIEETDSREIADFKCVTNADAVSSTGSVKIEGRAIAQSGSNVKAVLSKDGKTVKEETLPASQFTAVGISWNGIPVDLWWPNLFGDQPLYDIKVELIDENGDVHDKVDRRVGFKELSWKQNDDAPEGADPWICVVNGKPIFLQGINWTPILPNFADVKDEDYKKRIDLYKELGLNIFRVWGGAVLEKEIFYNLCDEAGIMVWQEFPLSSSGIDNYPPIDQKSIDRVAQFAESYVNRRQHHVSLAAWSGGNELMDANWVPVDNSHPMMNRLKRIVENNDPSRRFMSASPSGPSFGANADNYGKGLHWDVHGPWKIDKDMQSWIDYWNGDDSLFHSEAGCPGASPIDIIKLRAGDMDPLPATMANPLWRMPTSWWVEGDKFKAEFGHDPETIEEYIAWNQERQAIALSEAVKACKNRFPKCGGIILWMGHDCYPCLSNTSIVDFNGDPKPSALAISEIFKNNQ